MRRWGTITLVLFAFIVGFASTYSCGGGSSVNAGGDADTLEGYSASAFALSSHSHPEYATTAMLSSHTHSDYADSIHEHDGADITSGIVPVGRLPVGSSSSNVAAGNHTHSPGEADTLDGMDSNDFAYSSHSHSYSRTVTRKYNGQSTYLLGAGSYLLTEQGIPLPPELTSGGNVQVDAFFYEYASPSAVGDVVLSLILTEFGTGSVYALNSFTIVNSSEQLFAMTNALQILYKASWSVDLVGSDLITFGLYRGTSGSLTDTYPSNVNLVGVQMTY